MKSIIYLTGLLETFILNKNSKTKSEVQPWFCDKIILPHLKIICEFGKPEAYFEPFFELYHEIEDRILTDFTLRGCFEQLTSRLNLIQLELPCFSLQAQPCLQLF